jgi:hypothetical protein
MASTKSRFEIGAPIDFEHFLHVGFANLKDASRLAQTQQQAFEEVVARRRRELPQIPAEQKTARKKRLKQELEAKLSEPLSKRERDIFDEVISCLMASEVDRLDEILATSAFDCNRLDQYKFGFSSFS